MIRKFRQIIDLRKKEYRIVPYQRPSCARKIMRKLGDLADWANQQIDNLTTRLDKAIDSIRPKLAVSMIILSCVVMVLFAEPFTEAVSRTSINLAESLIIRPATSGIPL